MKKSLVLAMAMALGVTASAYAANPFSDVPAGHWAYDSIDKLAAAGVIDGMGDGTYQGDKTMTRYEMAQIVAKAMAKGANVDKLAAEFADELDNLGVRVANLEKKADNVKITGAISFHTRDGHGAGAKTAANGHSYMLRSDITLKGQINEDWTYTALIRNEQNFAGTKAGVGEEETRFQRAWVNGRVGGLKVQAGRYGRTYANGEAYNDRVDGIQASYGKAINVKVSLEQLSGNQTVTGSKVTGDSYAHYGADAKVIAIEAKTKLGKAADLELDYYMFKDLAGKKAAAKLNKADDTNDKVGQDDMNIFAVTANYSFSKNVKLTGTYLHSDADKGDKDGYAVKLAYKGASAKKAGSWGLYAKYVDLSQAVVIGNGNYSTPSFNPGDAKGYKGGIYGANYAFAKNMVGTVEFYDVESKEDKKVNYGTLYAGLAFSF